MHLNLFKLKSKNVRGRRVHHHLYNTSLNIYEQANTRTEVFYAVQGKRIDKKDKTRVDSLAHMLQRCLRSLQQHAGQARDLVAKDQISERDCKCILRFEKEVKAWLKNILDLQTKLQRQVDAEIYFQKQAEEDRKLKGQADERERMLEYLKRKPLPPLRKSIVSFTTGLKSRVTILPAEKDVEVWLALEDEELNPIIDSYRRSKMAFEQDGFMRMPKIDETWI